MRHFTIDQSGKVEFTNKDTILALSSTDIQYSILIPKKIKQEIFNQCDKKHKKKLTIRIFSYGLYLLLRNKVKSNSVIIIDNEYPGHGKDIKKAVAEKLKIESGNIRIDKIGKKDEAHRLAYQTSKGKLKPNEVITSKQLSLSKLYNEKKIKSLKKRDAKSIIHI